MVDTWGSAQFYWFDFESSSGVQILKKNSLTEYEWKVDALIDRPLTFQYMDLSSVSSTPVIRKFWIEKERDVLLWIADYFFSSKNKWIVPVNDNLWYDLTLFQSRCKVLDVSIELIRPDKKPFVDLMGTLVLLNKGASMGGFKGFTRNAGKPQKKFLPQDLFAKKDYGGIEKEILVEAEWFKRLWFSLQSKNFSSTNLIRI